jgi:hypothetical protein
MIDAGYGVLDSLAMGNNLSMVINVSVQYHSTTYGDYTGTHKNRVFLSDFAQQHSTCSEPSGCKRNGEERDEERTHNGTRTPATVTGSTVSAMCVRDVYFRSSCFRSMR